MAFLSIEEKDSIAHVLINRPEKLNALNMKLLQELKSYLEKIEREKKIKVLILTGAGDKAFSAGADIEEMKNLKQEDVHAFSYLGQSVGELIENASFIAISAVHGYVLGGGLEMALACDWIYSSEEAIFSFPEITLSLIPGFGGTQRLARAIGSRRAKELILTGKKFRAEEALSIGLVNRLISKENLLKETWNTAEQMAHFSKTSLLQAKKAINAWDNRSLSHGLSLELEGFVECFKDTSLGEKTWR